MELLSIDPRLVDLGERLREVNPEWVAVLSESFREGGMRTAIEVRAADSAGRYKLVSGAHRVTAAVHAELPLIPAIVFAGSDLEAKLREIEENLVRNELSEMDRGTFLAEHKTIYEALHPETRHGGDRRKKQMDSDVHLTSHPLASRFSAVAAAKMGVDERTVRRAVRRHAALSPAIRGRIANTWIADNGAAIDDLIGKGVPLPEPERHAVLDLLLDPENKVRNVGVALRQIRQIPAPDGAEAEFARLTGAWRKAGEATRTRFLAWIKSPAGKGKA